MALELDPNVPQHWIAILYAVCQPSRAAQGYCPTLFIGEQSACWDSLSQPVSLGSRGELAGDVSVDSRLPSCEQYQPQEVPTLAHAKSKVGLEL
eukprot:1354035-Amphidinium_carterae.1